MPSLALPYFNQRDELTVQNGLIFRGEHVVVPAKPRESMKNKIHSSHLGTEACLISASECIFWPGMFAEMKQLVESCEICRKKRVSAAKGNHEKPRYSDKAMGMDCN